MNTPDPLTKVGINGETVATEEGVGDYRVALFTMLNRNLETSYISNMVAKIVAQCGKAAGLSDLAVLAFQTRDVRGGKGERDLFRHLMAALAATDLGLAEKLVGLVPEYGCWGDLWKLWATVPALKLAVVRHVESVFRADSVVGARPSLLAKWLPREGSKWDGLARVLAHTLFSHRPRDERMAAYRREVSRLNRLLKTVEINMCGGTWADIVPAHVPGRNLKLHTRAFLNQKLKGGDLRKPDDEDRMTCRAHFLDFLDKAKRGEVRAKGADVVFPHEIVATLNSMYRREGNEEQIEMLEAQWAAIRETTAALGGLGRVVPMCDFSGSMQGLPLQISFALGLLISEINHPAFRDHIITFDSTPSWHSLVKYTSLYSKVRSLGGLGQGLSTNFYAAAMLILDKMVAGRVPVGEEPEDLIVLTDMGWDAASKPQPQYYGSPEPSEEASSPWASQIAKIRARFAEESAKLWPDAAEGWKVPRIVVWNLRAAYKDFQATAGDDGVIMISGWSPSVLKALQKEGIKTKTPYEGMRALLDDVRYDAVRMVVAKHLTVAEVAAETA